ncbi:MAG: hypothetical protein ACE5JG_13560, partial [Planctomycetota bacterium]
ADSLRKAMGKKKPELMEPFKRPFFEGCGRNGVAPETAEEIWNRMATFARYGFNKSHATAYAVITYQTAYLKANHPRAFLAALLTVDSGNLDKVSEALEECRRMEIGVQPPDVNRSGPDFVVEGDAIRFGLTSVKGVGRQAAESVVAARAGGGPFATLYDLAARTDTRVVNKTTLEALIRAGACDDLGGHRAQLLAALDPALRAAAAEQADRRAGQMNLLGDALEGAGAPAPPLPEVEPLGDAELLQGERDTTGRDWSSHPLSEHADLIQAVASRTARTVQECGEGDRVLLGGLVVGLQERVIRSGRNEGKRMARFRIEDFDGSVEAVVFSDAFQRHRELLADNRVLFFSGDVDASRDAASIRVGAVCTPDDAPRALAGSVLLHLAETDPERLSGLRRRIERHPGDRPLRLSLAPEPGVRVLLRTDLAVHPTPALIRELRELLGRDNVRLRPRPLPPRAPRRRP